MLQFDVMHFRCRENVAHRLRRYISLSVASGPVPDVEMSIPDVVPIASTTNKPIRLWRISANSPQKDAGYPTELFYDCLKHVGQNIPPILLLSRTRRLGENGRRIVKRRGACLCSISTGLRQREMGSC